jgi:hypothetical protein
MNTNGNHKGTVQIISQTLTSLPIEVNQLGKKLTELLFELNVGLAEGYTNLGQPAVALSTLEKVFNSQENPYITWSHPLLKRTCGF